MPLNWRQRLEQSPWLRDTSQWPVISTEQLPEDDHRAFVRNQQIVARVLAGEKAKHVAEELGVTPGRVTQLLARCLGGEATESPALTEGLLPNHVLGATRQRKADLPTMKKPSGSSCAFKRLLDEADGVRAGLDEMILAAVEGRAYGQHLTPKIVHREFKRLLGEIDWPSDRYPYTCANQALDAVRRYYHGRRAELQRERLERRAVEPPRRRPAIYGRERALRAIQIDEHLLDQFTRVNLALNDATVALRLARACVLAAVDRATSCVLGYYLALARHPNQDDMLTLIDRCIRPHTLPPLATPNMSYAAGAAFPCTVESPFPVTFGEVQFDNALMHSARSVVELLGEQLDASVHYGRPRTPTVRARIESIFAYIARAGTHRSAATSGTGPGDPKRESRKNAKAVPAVSIHTLNDALAVLLTEYNITPQAALGNISPLALYQHEMAEEYVAYTHPLRARQWQPLMGSRECKLHWYRDEHRRPHINFGGVRYEGPGLARVAGREQRIRVAFDRRDIRTLRASTLVGHELGTLDVARPWQRYPHTLGTRKRILKEVREHGLSARDPLGEHFRELLKNQGEQAADLQIVHDFVEFTSDGAPALVLDDASEPTVPPPDDEFTWSPGMAAHRSEP